MINPNDISKIKGPCARFQAKGENQSKNASIPNISHFDMMKNCILL